MPDSITFTDTAEVLTGPDRAAVAVIRIRCQQMSADHPANAFFCSVKGRRLTDCQLGRITYGDWRKEDVVVVRTQDVEWEVHCHGGSLPIQRILADLSAAGISSVNSGHELSSEGDSSRTTWSRLLQQSRTIATADLILGQPAAIERFAYDLNACGSASDVVNRVEQCLSWRPLVDHLVEPWVVAIGGQPNAGKSSLLNSIVGYQRSIVFDQPGTTRDTVACDVVIGGWPVRFVDTAGIRDQSHDAIEKLGISAARQAMRTADLCLVIVDQCEAISDADRDLLKFAQQSGNVAVVFNKTDLVAADASPANRSSACGFSDQVKDFFVSAKTGEGLPGLLDWLATALVPTTPSHTEALPIVPSLINACNQYLREGNEAKLIQQIESVAAEF